jgi:uncharacterized phage-associated protein
MKIMTYPAKKEMENFLFDEQKATQAAAFFTKQVGGEINYMKLIKLLYLADREALKRWGVPIAGGQYVSMDNGPVTSPIYDAVKSTAADFPVWKNCFRKEGYDLRLVSMPKLQDLSRAELEVLEFIAHQFGAKNEWELVLYTHEHCPEWSDPQGTSIPIPPEEILQKVGKTEAEIKAIGDEMAKLSIVERLLSKPS